MILVASRSSGDLPLTSLPDFSRLHQREQQASLIVSNCCKCLNQISTPRRSSSDTHPDTKHIRPLTQPAHAQRLSLPASKLWKILRCIGENYAATLGGATSAIPESHSQSTSRSSLWVLWCVQ